MENYIPVLGLCLDVGWAIALAALHAGPAFGQTPLNPASHNPPGSGLLLASGLVLAGVWKLLDSIQKRTQFQLKTALEQKHLELDLVRTHQEVTSRSRNTFLANMSREIRVPMSEILGMTQLALATPLTREQKEYVQAAMTSAESLLAVLSDIFDLSLLQAGALVPQKGTFDAYECVQSAVQHMEEAARRKGLALHCTVHTNVPALVIGDAPRIRQVLSSILFHAIRFSANGVVRLEVRRLEQEVYPEAVSFSVLDNGEEIPETQRELILDPYSAPAQFGASGLALGISRHLVRLMGGNMRVDWEPGIGNRFCFDLPLPAATPDVSLFQHRNEKSPRGMRILLVDDNVINQRFMSRALGRLGHDIHLASNGGEALLKLEQAGFDVVLMDVQMPEMDGLVATRLLRQRECTCGGHVPVLAITANAMRGDREECLQAGMDGYLSMPVQLDDLLSAISGVIEPAA